MPLVSHRKARDKVRRSETGAKGIAARMADATALDPSRRQTGRAYGLRLIRALAWAVAFLCLLPMLAVSLAAMTGGGDSLAHLWQTVLPGYIATTLLLVVLVGTGTTLRDRAGAAAGLPGLCAGLCLYPCAGSSRHRADHAARP
jgi:hypothetical protein